MQRPEKGFEADLRISIVPVIVAFACIGIMVLFLVNVPFGLVAQLQVLAFAGFIAGLTLLIWRLDKWNSVGARWFSCFALMLLIHMTNFWLNPSAVLILAPLPVALAAALIDLKGAALVAVAQTLLLVLIYRFLLIAVPLDVLIVSLAMIWAIVGVMVAVYVPVHRVADWAWAYFTQARDLLEEARDRRAKLEKALKDLSDANQQLTRLNLLAQGLRQVAEDARTAKEQFVANVSHELRTPLNMITGFSEMVLQSPETYGERIPPALLADLAVIHRNAEHLSALIDDVLDLSQIETGQMALTKESVPLASVVETAFLAVRPLYDSKGLYLKSEIAHDLPTIFCDRTRIREVLLNLLSNAGRFTDQGGVMVRAWQAEKDIMVTVTDTGPGIACKDIPKLFQPFQQLDGSIRRRYGGTGLGLSISKRFIELHDGEIWVESEPGVGTTFCFRLPLRAATSISTDSWRRLKPDWEFFDRRQSVKPPETHIAPRFVVLESEDALLRLLNRYLDEVEMVPVRTMTQALAALEQVPAQGLLVNSASVTASLDTLMSSPVLPGNVPVMVCSVPGMREASEALGVSERLVKPISQEKLLGALEKLDVDAGTILIVDDEPDALQLLGRMLNASGRAYRVLLARDGNEALNVLHELRPDAILLDLVMPGMDGFQLLEIKRQDETLRDIPTIVISARDPAGQPIVSSAFAVTRSGGLSITQLLKSIQFMSQELSVFVPVAGPEPSQIQPA